MKSFLYSAPFIVVGSAAHIRRDQCCFEITATGGVSGVMGQLDDGQNRLNGTYLPATYCYSNGGITDSEGRGCIVTTTNDATHQFQCDQGTVAQAGFSIGAGGSLSFDGDDQFYACPYNNGDIIEYNVYSQQLAGQDKCRAVNLSTGGKCATSSAICSVVATTIYPTAASSIVVLSVPYYSSASSAMIPGSSPILPVTTAYSSSIDVVPTSESTVPPLGSQIVVIVPSGDTPSATTLIASTYSADSSTSAPPTSVVIVSLPASSVGSSSSHLSSVVSVPAYQASSTASTSTWATIASTSVSASKATTTSTLVIASRYYEASTTAATTTTSASVCQTALTGTYQTPHLIVPISSSSPDTAYGTQYDAYIDSENSTIFNFDIPSSYEGMTCTTIFLFPEIADLETSSYKFSGSGDLVFSELSAAATEETTYNTAPSVSSVLDTIAIASGNSYVVSSGSCAAGTTVSIELGSESGLSLEFFEDWNPSSLGLYITAC